MIDKVKLRTPVLYFLILAITSACTLSAQNEFVSDGCSLFPNGNFADRSLWLNCCIEHDRAYWTGGSEEQRKLADLALRDCVAKTTGNQVLADVMYAGVRVGGESYFPTHYRWGYGKPYDLTSEHD